MISVITDCDHFSGDKVSVSVYWTLVSSSGPGLLGLLVNCQVFFNSLILGKTFRTFTIKFFVFQNEC